jgi:hypothetical protein
VLAAWGGAMVITSLALSIAVNILVTGLIVFKILKVFLEVKSTFGTTRGTKLQRVIIVIIESGMALFAIQLVRFVLYLDWESLGPNVHYILVIGMQEMVNVITIFVHFYFFFILITFISLGHRTNNDFGAGLNGIVFQ